VHAPHTNVFNRSNRVHGSLPTVSRAILELHTTRAVSHSQLTTDSKSISVDRTSQVIARSDRETIVSHNGTKLDKIPAAERSQTLARRAESASNQVSGPSLRPRDISGGYGIPSHSVGQAVGRVVPTSTGPRPTCFAMEAVVGIGIDREGSERCPAHLASSSRSLRVSSGAVACCAFGSHAATGRCIAHLPFPRGRCTIPSPRLVDIGFTSTVRVRNNHVRFRA